MGVMLLLLLGFVVVVVTGVIATRPAALVVVVVAGIGVKGMRPAADVLELVVAGLFDVDVGVGVIEVVVLAWVLVVELVELVNFVVEVVEVEVLVDVDVVVEVLVDVFDVVVVLEVEVEVVLGVYVSPLGEYATIPHGYTF